MDVKNDITRLEKLEGRKNVALRRAYNRAITGGNANPPSKEEEKGWGSSLLGAAAFPFSVTKSTGCYSSGMVSKSCIQDENRAKQFLWSYNLQDLYLLRAVVAARIRHEENKIGKKQAAMEARIGPQQWNQNDSEVQQQQMRYKELMKKMEEQKQRTKRVKKKPEFSMKDFAAFMASQQSNMNPLSS